MNWFVDTIQTSIGKKLLMAITGLGFIGFLFIHLVGNLTFYFGKDVFLAYVEYLHSFEPVVVAVEIVLLILAAIHVITGVTLFLQNRRARPKRYKVNESGGGRTIGSATMPYTGFLILLFVILHLQHFHFIDATNQTVFDAAVSTFSLWYYTGIYIAAVIIVGLHIRHGFWSLFQTIGWNHDRYMPAIRTVGVLFAVAVAVGFGFIPVYIGITAG